MPYKEKGSLAFVLHVLLGQRSCVFVNRRLDQSARARHRLKRRVNDVVAAAVIDMVLLEDD
jgi:hypothetical protein